MSLDLDSVLQATNSYNFQQLMIYPWWPFATSFFCPGLDVHDFAESMLDAKAKARNVVKKSFLDEWV